MKLEVGKYYRTRSGEKVGPIHVAKKPYRDDLYQYGKTVWYENGKFHTDDEHPLDLTAEWPTSAATPTVGTLAEIGAKVGDVVAIPSGETHKVTQRDLEYWNMSDYRIISRAYDATPSPVRTVTRKEIVPGVYGRVKLHDGGAWGAEIEFVGDYGWTGYPRLTPAELRAAIATLTEIADAMDGE